jgi:hypothetical protein
MASKRERFLQELAAEDDTPAVTEPTPDPAPAPEPEPSPEPDPEPQQEPEPEPSPDPQPDPEPNPEPEKKERTIPDDKFERAEFSFRRQLSKTKDKYERELKDRDEKYAKLEAELAELKKATTPKKELKREDFPDDEDFIRALQEDAVKKAFAERDEENARKAAEQAEADKRRREEEEAIRAATFNHACAIGAQDVVGSIASGKRADFVICSPDYTAKRVFLAGNELK